MIVSKTLNNIKKTWDMYADNDNINSNKHYAHNASYTSNLSEDPYGLRNQKYNDNSSAIGHGNLVPSPEIDEDEVVVVKPEFQKQFDDLQLLTMHINQAKNYLPERLKPFKLTIANKGVSKLNYDFQRNGL
eukprot:209370_1